MGRLSTDMTYYDPYSRQDVYARSSQYSFCPREGATLTYLNDNKDKTKISNNNPLNDFYLNYVFVPPSLSSCTAATVYNGQCNCETGDGELRIGKT